MNRKKYGRKLSAIAVAAALTFMGVVQGLPQAHAAAITMDKAPSIGYVDADGQPAKDASGNAITAPQLGYVLMVDPGQWKSADGSAVKFSYTWSRGVTNTCGTNMGNSDNVTGGARTARNFVPLYSQIGQYLCVVVRVTNGNDYVDADKLATSAALVGFNPAMTALPASYADISTNLVGTGYKTKAWLTAYGWPDNSPAGADIANSFRSPASTYPALTGTASSFNNRGGGIHPGGSAGGDGSYGNPLTLAAVVNNTGASTAQPSLIPWGTQIYVPRVQKYFIAEDVCYECTGDYGGQGTVDGSDGLGLLLGPGGDGGPGMIHFDMWVGGQNDVFADVMACENQITMSGMDDIIVNPAADLKVRDGNIYHVDDQGNKICNGEPLEEASGGLVGQFRSVDPKEEYPDAGYSEIAQWDTAFGDANAARMNFANADLAWPIFDGAAVTSTTLVRPDMKNVGVHPTGELCITDPGNSAEAGTWLTLEPCLKSDANEADLASQMVSYAGSFLVFNNMCFDLSRDGKGNPDIGSINWDDQDYSSDKSPNYSETISPGIRPVTLHKCNYGTSDQWQVNPDGSITDMQTGYWTFGNMGPDADGVTHLWALPMENIDEAAYANSFWDDPGTRGENDSAPVAVDAPAPLSSGDDVIVTVSGLTTPTFQLLLVTKANPDGVVLLDNIPVPLQASGASSGTWTGAVTLPSNIKRGAWFRIEAVALTDVVPFMEITGGTTAVNSTADLQTNPSGRWSLKNFADPPVPVTISIQGVSGKLIIPKSGSYTDTGGQVTGSMVPWILLAGLVSIAGVLILVRRQAIVAGVRK